MASEITKSAVDRFGELFATGMAKLVEACRVYAEAVKADPSQREAFARKYPQFNSYAWANFERVGNNELDARLLTASFSASGYLRALPVNRQKDALDNGVDVLTENGESLRVSVENLQPLQARQVFNGRAIRTLAEQRAWIEEQRQNEALRKAKPVNAGYVVTKNGVVTTGPVTLSWTQLAQILAERK